MIPVIETLYQSDIIHTSSKQTHEYYEIPFVNESGKKYKTYAVPGYENYYKWEYLIDNPDDRVIIKNVSVKSSYSKPKKASDGALVIDADCDYQIIDVMTSYEKEELFKQLGLT